MNPNPNRVKPHPYKQTRRKVTPGSVGKDEEKNLTADNITLKVPRGAVPTTTDLEIIVHESDFLIFEITANKQHREFSFVEGKLPTLYLKHPGSLNGAKLMHFGPTGYDEIELTPLRDDPGTYTASIPSCSIFVLATP